ncbi:hypothetical protein J7E96_35570 [Streptomyces sp. ISL-96]|uniref:hypothetical protein n=1 Tax=Streptomyces sp. ISL-96 TaxID=2819191 RepID=UPI001BE5A338|nr:hypothetical protein [Streptomyces sp. ISL-96]MBT2493726.1 hypothetical protein [Streptomyces sp. ISL-96]
MAQHNQWRAGQVLAYIAEHDADTFEGWFCQRLQDLIAQGWYASPLPHDGEVRAEKIAAAAAWYDTWWGDRSRMHSELLEYFTALADRVPALQAVVAAGRSQQQELLRETEEQERTARVRGGDHTAPSACRTVSSKHSTSTPASCWQPESSTDATIYC